MDETLEVRIGAMLLERKLTIATAESCTGGLVAHRLTNISGSSAYVIGGVVSYSNEAKETLLRVKHETLLAHGAVSEETATEMALGALAQFDTDFAVSITGIAGPGGGTEQKPVGLTYIGLGRK
ncbi:MAG: nicotinamide-nucleotide amidohydrolase family protein, partial [Burkholderiales bacterium]|nr:nicotinamide-nucleotide amidohydrolase family protein [Anaerolineae bacterium]